jgi:hypothetical protein
VGNVEACQIDESSAFQHSSHSSSSSQYLIQFHFMNSSLAASYILMATSSSTSMIFLLMPPKRFQLHETVENVHKAWAAVSLAKASFTSSFFTKSLALALIVGHGFSRKSGFFFSTWVVITKYQTQNK